MKLTMLMMVATQSTVSGIEMMGCRVTVMLVSGTERWSMRSAAEQQGDDGGDLAGELEQRLDLGEVVDHADGGDDRAADQDGLGRGVVLDEHQGRDHHAQVDGEAAEQGRHPGVHAARVARPVDDPRAARQPGHGGRGENDDARREDEPEYGELDRAWQLQQVAYGSSSLTTTTPASANISRDSSSGYPSA